MNARVLREVTAQVPQGGPPRPRGPAALLLPKNIYIYMYVLSLFAGQGPNSKMRPQAFSLKIEFCRTLS